MLRRDSALAAGNLQGALESRSMCSLCFNLYDRNSIWH